jgi:hypothetical protein
MTKIFVWPFITFLIFSCAKKPEYDTVYKVAEQTNRSQDYDTDSIYVYVPSTLDTPRNVAIKMPYYQDEEVLVKLKWTKEGLSVFAPDKDYRFDFSRNQRPIFTIPGNYRAYRCSKNNIGECTNREEEDYETHWSKRAYFDPDFERIDFSRSLTTMDVWQDDGCIIKKNVRLKDYELKRGLINIELEREFRIHSSDSCLSKYLKYEAQKLNTQDFSFKTTFFYSLVRLKDLASPDYEKFNYPLLDQDKFGYFLSFRKTLDDNFIKSKKEYLLNRWNPKQKFLTYHLSDSFNDPDMEIFKKATYEAVDSINVFLKTAEVPFKIKLEEPSGKKSGDLRYNTIVLITDPLRNGLLGYAPAVSNPLTGEIIQSHINMYGGVLKAVVPSIYSHMVYLSHQENKIQFKGGESRPEIPSLIDAETEVGRESSSPKSPPINVPRNNTFRERIDFYSKHNAYPKELLLSGGIYKKYIPGIKEIKEIWLENGTLVRWEDLSDSQKEQVTSLVLPQIYKQTFVHEFGHSLGLRHNFKGSVDQKHFYYEGDPAVKLLDDVYKSVDGEKVYNPPQFSSVMDYGYSSLDDLPTFGKYDIAALRYGYARKVELESKDGEKRIVPIGKKGIKPLQIPTLVDYQFCTDENVRADPLCNRFDEGTTYTEIVNHYISKYEAGYYQLNYRNDRTNFTSYENINYFWWRYTEFDRIRNIFEAWESYASSLLARVPKIKSFAFRRDQLTKEVEKCKKNPIGFCKNYLDLHNATILAGKFFLDIIRKSEHVCAFLIEGKFFSFALKTLHQDFGLKVAPKSCFDSSVVQKIKSTSYMKKWKLLGERGRYLTDLREFDPRWPYGSDISARGIWMDKVLAMQFLYGRNLPTYKSDDPEFSFKDHPVIGPLVEKVAANMFDQSEFEEGPAFTNKFGHEVNLKAIRPIRYNERDNPEIKTQTSQMLNYFLDLPWRSSFFLSRPMISAAENYLQTQSPKIAWQAKIDRDFFRVKKIPDHQTINTNIYPDFYFGKDGFIYAASVSNLLAGYLILGIKHFTLVEDDPEINEYVRNQAKLENYLDPLKVISQIYGRKNNPNVYYKERIPAIGRPIQNRLDGYFSGVNPAIINITRDGGSQLEKVIDLAGTKEKLELADFAKIYDKKTADNYYKAFKLTNVDEMKAVLLKIGADIDVINLPLSEIKKVIFFANALEKEGSNLTIDGILPVDEKYREAKVFILSNMKSKDIVKIHDWLQETTKAPADFPVKKIYNLDLEILKAIKETHEFKEREELEYTLKNLPSY